MTRTCKKCGESKAIDEFRLVASRGIRLNSCRRCENKAKIARAAKRHGSYGEAQRAQKIRAAERAGDKYAVRGSRQQIEFRANLRRAESLADRVRRDFFKAESQRLEQLHRATFPEDIQYLRSAMELQKRADEVRARYWADPQRSRQYKRIYKAANPDKTAAYCGKRGERILSTADGTLSPGNLSRLFDRAKCCAYCGKQMDTVAQKSLDHFVPLCLGGRHSVANVVICCLPCNMSKNQTHPFIWLGKERFEEILTNLRQRCSGDPSDLQYLYPVDQVEAVA